MQGPLFKTSLPEIVGQLMPDEDIRDVETLYTIIVAARRETSGRSAEDERIALVSLCFFAWPGKAPAYRKQAPLFRQRFRGVSRNPTLQRNFRERLKPLLLQAASAEDLMLTRIEDLFVVRTEEDGKGSKLPGLPIPPASPQRKPVPSFIMEAEAVPAERKMETRAML
jgi:hypothetical protein